MALEAVEMMDKSKANEWQERQKEYIYSDDNWDCWSLHDEGDFFTGYTIMDNSAIVDFLDKIDVNKRHFHFNS